MQMLTAAESGSLAAFIEAISWERFLSAAILVVVCGVAIRVLLRMLDRVLGRSKLDKAVQPFLRTALKMVLLFVALMIVAEALGIDTSSLLAVLSVVGLAVSLALQNLLGNMASAVILLTTRPFQIGHFIEVDGISGTVVKIGAIYTDIQTADNQIAHLPNSQITASRLTNYTSSGKRRLVYAVSAAYSAPTEAVKAALLRAAEHPLRMPNPAPIAHVNGYGESAVNYILYVWIEPKDYMEVYFDVLERIRVEFDAAGIEMTYPHVNVHIAERKA